MKKTLLTLLLATCIHFAFSQKLMKPEIDKISGDTTWRTNEELVYAKVSLMGANYTVGLQSSKIGSGYSLWIAVGEPKDATIYTVSAGSKAYLKLDDKSLITLKAAKDNLRQSLGTNTSTFGSIGEGTKTLTVYSLSKDDLKALASQNVEFIRVESSRGNLEYDIKPKLAEKFKKDCELLLAK